MKTLFFVGNKRSGTSMLVRLLNFHPEVFVSHESDVVWTLFQIRNGLPEVFKAYPEDGPLGMQATLQSAAEIYSALPPKPDQESLTAAFFSIQKHLMMNGSNVQGAYPNKGQLSWIGDKKPVQQADPEILKFTLELLPDSMFVHVVRNPYAVFRSITRASRHWKVVPEYWKGGVGENLRRWLLHEEWVQQAKDVHEGLIHSMRYEDILAKPVEIMQQCFACLGLDMPNDVREKVRTLVSTGASRNMPPDNLTDIDGLFEMMSRYGYSPDGHVAEEQASTF